MRPITTMAIVLALCLGCGGSSPPVGNVEPGTRRLAVTVEGDGRVVSNPAGIDCTSSTCNAPFADGTTVSLVATSAAGSKFTGWGMGCSGPGPCSVTLHGDVQVFAHFDRAPPPQVTVSAAVSGPGQVTGGGLTCGNAANTCSATMAPGASVTLTAAAAPQARFMGWGGACSGNASTCQLPVQSDTAVTAAFEFELQTLAANDGTNLSALALNSTHVFFGRRTSDGASVWSVPKSGGAPARVASGVPTFIVADDAFVYWTDTGAIYSAPVEGGPASQLATGLIGRLALDELGALYWVELRTTTQPGAVHRMQNRVDAVIARGQDANSGVAVDSAFAYFTCLTLDFTETTIRRVPRLGGTVDTLVKISNNPVAAVRVDPQNLYYRDFSGFVWAAPKTGGTSHLVSTGNRSAFGVTNIDLDVNASVVWWTWNDLPSATKGLFRANADGSGWTPVETSTGNDSTWSGPRVDDTAVYYFHAGALLKRLK